MVDCLAGAVEAESEDRPRVTDDRVEVVVVCPHREGLGSALRPVLEPGDLEAGRRPFIEVVPGAAEAAERPEGVTDGRPDLAGLNESDRGVPQDPINPGTEVVEAVAAVGP